MTSIIFCPHAALAWTPFLEPMPGVHAWWWALMVPLIVLISAGYKGIRVTDPREFTRGTLTMSLQLIALIVMLGLALAVAVWLVG